MASRETESLYHDNYMPKHPDVGLLGLPVLVVAMTFVGEARQTRLRGQGRGGHTYHFSFCTLFLGTRAGEPRPGVLLGNKNFDLDVGLAAPAPEPVVVCIARKEPAGLPVGVRCG